MPSSIKRSLRKHRLFLFFLCIVLVLTTLFLSTSLPNWSVQHTVGYVAIVISLASLFNSLNWPRIVDLRVVPEDLAQGGRCIDLGDGNKRSNILVYNLGETRARMVTIKLTPVKAAKFEPEEKQLIKQTSVELLSKANLDDPRWSLISRYLVWNIKHPDEPFWVSGLDINDEKYVRVTEMFMRRAVPLMQLNVGDVSSEEPTKVIPIPYDVVRRWASLDETKIQGLHSTRVRLSYGYIDETTDGFVSHDYPDDIEIVWK